MKATRRLDIVLRSAAGLQRVHTASRMAAYAVAWLEPSVRVPSPVDTRHGRNPVWDATISIALDELTLGRAGKNLHIELLAQGLVSTTPVGFVRVDMTELLLKGADGAAASAKFHDYPVTRRSGRQQGTISFELCLQALVSPSPPQDVIATPPTRLLPPQVGVAPATMLFPSTPPLLQLIYERDSSTRRKSASQRRREIASEDNVGHDVRAPKRSNSRGTTHSALRQEEHSLLDESYSYF